MSDLTALTKQIEKLQSQANEIRKRDFNATVIEIQEKMQAFGITISDLKTPSKGVPKGKKVKAAGKSAPKKKAASKDVPIKYKGPNGEAWTGRGLMPKWMKAQLEQGKAREDFLLAKQPA